MISNVVNDSWCLLAFRLEKVEINCLYSKVKLLGTLLCVVVALTMSLMHSTATARESPIVSASLDVIFDPQKIIGSMYLLAAVFVLSCNVVLQVILSIFTNQVQDFRTFLTMVN